MPNAEPAPPASGEITALLQRWSGGERAAFDALTPLVYAELHRLARRALRGEHEAHTLQTTALVNEAFIRLIGQDRTQWRNRAHFAAIAAQAMRRILMDEARHRHAAAAVLTRPCIRNWTKASNCPRARKNSSRWTKPSPAWANWTNVRRAWWN